MDKEEIYKFIHSPDTVDFVVRQSEYFASQVSNNPMVIVSQILSGRYVLCYTTKENFQTIKEKIGTSFISSASVLLGIMDRPSLENSGITQVQQQPYLDLKGHGVLIGFVDTGIDYTLDVFQYEDGTSKIQYIFDQSIEGSPPEGYYIGTEYTNEQINEALKSDHPQDLIPHKDTAGHGTFLASIAAGRSSDNFTSAAPDSEIIMVKLKKARPYYLEQYAIEKSEENVFESSAVMVGVEYILDKARFLGRPVVICIGIGTNMGSHDGFSIFEEYLSSISNLAGVCICTAAGNECQARHHMQDTITAKGETKNIDIKVDGERCDIYLSIWNSASDRMSASVRSPSGELIGRVPAKSGLVIQEKLILEPSIVSIEYYFPVEGSGGQLTVIKIVFATPGIWTITMYGDIILNGKFDAWLPITGFVSDKVEFLSATPYCTITVPATMIGAISCGAYDHMKHSLYAKSSWGPTRMNVLSPEIIAPGVNVGGYYPIGFGTMNGTSVSAAITSGACALLLQWGIIQKNDISLSTYQIRAYLIRGCDRSDSMSYPNTQWGYGVLNLMKTFQLMRET